MRSQPACANERATTTASSPVSPPSAQSVAEMRTDIGFSSGHAVRMARNTRAENACGFRGRRHIRPSAGLSAEK